MPFIQYIGRREDHVDSLYGTGEWTKGQQKDVSEVVAAKMLKHGDVYTTNQEVKQQQANGCQLFSMAAWPGICGKVKNERLVNHESENEKDDQQARDAVAAMSSKEAIADYAKINFNHMIPKTLSLENMKQRAIILIDRYGAQ